MYLHCVLWLLKTGSYVLVDEDQEYECASVLSSHTQDVKCVLWHPHEDVSLMLIVSSRLSTNCLDIMAQALLQSVSQYNHFTWSLDWSVWVCGCQHIKYLSAVWSN